MSNKTSSDAPVEVLTKVDPDEVDGTDEAMDADATPDEQPAEEKAEESAPAPGPKSIFSKAS